MVILSTFFGNYFTPLKKEKSGKISFSGVDLNPCLQDMSIQVDQVLDITNVTWISPLLPAPLKGNHIKPDRYYVSHGSE